MHASHDLAPGTEVAGLRVLATLRRPADGSTVYRVEAPAGRSEALRTLPSGVFGEHSGRFLAAARRLEQSRHPALPRVLTTGRAKGLSYLLAAEAEGQTLADLLSVGLSPPRSIKLIEQVGGALDVAHAAGLSHGDVRPENVLVVSAARPQALLIDFVLAGRRRDRGVPAVHLPYAAPELLLGEKCGRPGDVYSLACMLWECLAGTPPFGRDASAAQRGHLDQEPPRLSEHVDLPAALDPVMARALAKDQQQRHDGASDLFAEAARALGAERADVRPVTPRLARPATQHQLPAGAPPVAASRRRGPEAGGPIREPLAEPGRRPTRRAGRPAPRARADQRPHRRRRGVPPTRSARSTAGALRKRVSPDLALLAIALASLAGYAVGETRDGDAGGEPARASSSALAIDVPVGWTPTARPATAIGGVALRRPVALEPLSGQDGRIAVGLLPAGGAATFDPAFIARRVIDRPPPAQLVRIGRLQGYRWRGIRLRGSSGSSTLVTVPTTAGVAALTCSGDVTSLASACARATATLGVARARGYDLAEDASWWARLDGGLRRLAQRRAAGLVRLREASSRLAQARDAASLARAHESALRGLVAVTPPTHAAQVARRVSTQLRDLSGAYERLADAARGDSARAYKTASRDIRVADAGLRRWLRRSG